MRKLLVALVAIGGLAVLWSLSSRAEDDKKPVAIKEVMQTCMKGGLCKKIADGGGSDEEKKKLLAMFQDLGKNKPPKGDEESWKKKTTALVEAAQAIVDKKEDGVAKLKAAANCAACHGTHKGK
jgi:cytochrome c553